jgi:hypothetical protein
VSPTRTIRAKSKELIVSQYLLTVYYEEDAPEPSEEDTAKAYADVDALNEKIKAAGAWVFAGGLHTPDTATVVRSDHGEVITTDGPFPEAKEQIGGFWVIEAADMDQALDWAAQATVACQAPVEIRPFHDEPEA